MKGIHIRDDIKTLSRILGYSMNTFDEYLHTVTWGHVLCGVEIRQSTFN